MVGATTLAMGGKHFERREVGRVTSVAAVLTNKAVSLASLAFGFGSMGTSVGISPAVVRRRAGVTGFTESHTTTRQGSNTPGATRSALNIEDGNGRSGPIEARDAERALQGRSAKPEIAVGS